MNLLLNFVAIIAFDISWRVFKIFFLIRNVASIFIIISRIILTKKSREIIKIVNFCIRRIFRKILIVLFSDYFINKIDRMIIIIFRCCCFIFSLNLEFFECFFAFDRRFSSKFLECNRFAWLFLRYNCSFFNLSCAFRCKCIFRCKCTFRCKCSFSVFHVCLSFTKHRYIE